MQGGFSLSSKKYKGKSALSPANARDMFSHVSSRNYPHEVPFHKGVLRGILPRGDKR
jgi:hypothetical protein